MGKGALVVAVVGVCALPAAQASISFTPAAGYSAQTVWSGTNGAHFSVEGGSFYIYGAEEVSPGTFENVVRRFDGATTSEIARTSSYAAGTYYPDAITVLDGAVYWAHVKSYSAGGAATLYKTSFSGGTWQTTQVLDASAGVNVISLSTDGSHVFGAGLGASGENVAFFLDDGDNYGVLAELPALGSGASGFAPSGDFFAGAWGVGGDYAAHMYRFSAQQVSDRVSGLHAVPFGAADAIDDLIVPSNASTVMESDGALLYGTNYNTSYTGTNPYGFDLVGGGIVELGTLSGAATTVATDMYARDGDVFFMGKDDWGNGDECAIYRIVPEPSSLVLLAFGLLTVARRRER